MLPSTGYFKGINCPFYDSGLCERPYCHFRHSRKECADQNGDSIENGEILQQLVSEALKKVLSHKDSNSAVAETSSTNKSIISKVVQELKPTTSNKAVNPISKVTYNPTPIAQLNKLLPSDNVPPATVPEKKESHVKRHIPVPYTPHRPTRSHILRLPFPSEPKSFIQKKPDEAQVAHILDETKYTPVNTGQESNILYLPGSAVDKQPTPYNPVNTSTLPDKLTNDKYSIGNSGYIPTDIASIDGNNKVALYTPSGQKNTGATYNPGVLPAADYSTSGYSPENISYSTSKIGGISPCYSSARYEPTPLSKSGYPNFSSDEDEPVAKKLKQNDELDELENFESEFELLGQILDDENTTTGKNVINPTVNLSKSSTGLIDRDKYSSLKGVVATSKQKILSDIGKSSSSIGNVEETHKKPTKPDILNSSTSGKSNNDKTKLNISVKVENIAQSKDKEKCSDKKGNLDKEKHSEKRKDRPEKERHRDKEKPPEKTQPKKEISTENNKRSDKQPQKEALIEKNKSTLNDKNANRKSNKSGSTSDTGSHKNSSKSTVSTSKSGSQSRTSSRSSESRSKHSSAKHESSHTKSKHDDKKLKDEISKSRHSSSKPRHDDSKSSKKSDKSVTSEPQRKSSDSSKSKSSSDRNKSSKEKIAKGDDVQQLNESGVDSDVELIEEISDNDEDEINEECLKIFEEYVPTAKEKVNSHPVSKPDEKKDESLGKKRLAHPTNQTIYRSAPAVLPNFKTKAALMMTDRYAKVREYHDERGTVKPVSDVSQTKKSSSTTSETPSTSSSNTSSKVRIAHVPNVSTLLNAKKALVKPAAPPLAVTISQTITKGANRIAHVPSDTFSERPGVLEALASKIPVNIRSRYLNLMIDECLKIYLTTEDAYERSQQEELSTNKKCTAIPIYKNSAILTISRLRKEFQEANGIKKSISDDSNSISHSKVLMGKIGQKTSWSIENKYKNEIDSSNFKGIKFFKNISPWILTEQQLQDNGFPRIHPDIKEKGVAKIFTKNTRQKPQKGNIRWCCRCKKEYAVDKKGFPLIIEECIYHPNNKYRFRGEVKYQCCSQDGSSDGCLSASCHVYEYVDHDNLRGFVKTLSKHDDFDENTDYGVYALDCEMCYTTNGLDLTRVTVIDTSCKVIYESLVKPIFPIIDYNTRYSGITEEQMEGVTTTLLDVQATFLHMFSDKTILVGHSLESDFKALKLLHDTVVDTSVLFPHKMGPPYKRALRNLSSEYIRKIIQNSVDGHDSAEDATVCMELLIWKLKEELKLR